MSVQDTTPPAKAGVHFTTLNPISRFCQPATQALAKLHYPRIIF
jgi:hypothetical protein